MTKNAKDYQSQISYLLEFNVKIMMQRCAAYAIIATINILFYMVKLDHLEK